jgi:hypothetical protein
MIAAVADTHAVVWYLYDDKRLSPGAGTGASNARFASDFRSPGRLRKSSPSVSLMQSPLARVHFSLVHAVRQTEMSLLRYEPTVNFREMHPYVPRMRTPVVDAV